MNLIPFIALVRKDLILYLSNRRAVILNLVMPIALGAFFGYLFGRGEHSQPGQGYAHAFGGMSVQFVLFMAIEAGVSVLLAQRMGLWSRMLAAPVSSNTLMLARLASSAIISFWVMLVVFAVAVLGFKVPVNGNPVGLLGIAACFSLMAATFGLLIAAIGKTPEAARPVATFATLIMVMLGGAWVPSFFFPAWLQTATLFVPTRWAVDGFDAMTYGGLGIDTALKSMGVQLAFAAAFGAIALWKMRRA